MTKKPKEIEVNRLEFLFDEIVWTAQKARRRGDFRSAGQMLLNLLSVAQVLDQHELHGRVRGRKGSRGGFDLFSGFGGGLSTREEEEEGGEEEEEHDH